MRRRAAGSSCQARIRSVELSPRHQRSSGILPYGVEDSLALFGNDATVSEQLRRIEEETFSTEHKRWLGVRDDDGTIVALAALVQLEGVGYLDNVATFPEARGRGMATAIVSRAIELARGSGAEHVSLFADPDALPVVQMYERLGFRDVGRLASTKGAVTDVPSAVT